MVEVENWLYWSRFIVNYFYFYSSTNESEKWEWKQSEKWHTFSAQIFIASRFETGNYKVLRRVPWMNALKESFQRLNFK
jgi:hypothetical protein